jgi:hypothetical protein
MQGIDQQCVAVYGARGDTMGAGRYTCTTGNCSRLSAAHRKACAQVPGRLACVSLRHLERHCNILHLSAIEPRVQGCHDLLLVVL